MVPKLGGFFGVSRDGATQTRQNIPRQASARLAPPPGARVHIRALVQSKESLDLADDLPAGALGIKHLIEKTKEGAPQIIDPISAVGALVGLREQSRWQPPSEELIEVKEALLAQTLDTAAQGRQPGAEGRK